MLEICNLTAGYGKREVLHSLSVCFEAGKLTSVVGPNGCGKSTLLKAALGLIPRRSGEVYLDGSNLLDLRRKEIARRVAYLAQGQEIPAMTVGQLTLHGRYPYLEYPRGYSLRDRELASAAMERVGIRHLADEPLSALSGGMRQTAYLAMALAGDTPYVLLDEPTTYLDVAHQSALMGLLASIKEEGRGVVAVMHDLPLALTFSDQVAVMDSGQITALDTPSEMVRSGVLRQVFGVDVQEADGVFLCRWR